MQTSLKSTPLLAWHRENAAKIAGFAGYEMPLWYSSAKNEHLAVLTHAGLFDTSHMAVISLSGPDGRDLLQHCFSRDLNACIGRDRAPLSDQYCIYGVFLNEQGHVLDDAIVYQLQNQEFLIVVNAGMGEVIASYLKEHQGQNKAIISDLSDQLGKIDLQGPLAGKIMQSMLKNPEDVLNNLPYFSFKGHFDPSSSFASQVLLADQTPVLLSRSGYTGEFGFELFVDPGDLPRIWEMILDRGERFFITPCGLAARDSLRTGAVLPLSHQDIGDWPFVNNPWTFALPYTEDYSSFSKDFVGSRALLLSQDLEFTYAYVGRDPRKVPADENSKVLNSRGEEIGRILTCTTDMGIDWVQKRIYSLNSPNRPADFKPRGLCCGFVKLKVKLNMGEEIKLTDGKRTLSVQTARDIRPDRTARRALQSML